MSRREDQEHGNALVREVGSPGAFEAWQKREQALAQATTPEQAADLAAKMAAVARYFKRSKRLLKDQNEVALFRMRCLIKAGLLLKAMPKNPGSRRLPRVTASAPPRRVPTLEERGISKRDSKKWQDFTALEDARLRSHCREMTKLGKLMTEASCLALLPERQLRKQAEREKPWTLDTELGPMRRLLWAMLARCPQDARDDLVGHLRAWATEIEEETNATRTEENKA